MAYNNRKESKEHAFKIFQKDLKEDNFKSLVLFCGIEDYLINWATDLLVDKYINEVTKTLDYDNVNLEVAEVDNIIASCETPPMMSLRKVVLLKNYNGKYLKELIEYVKDLPETTILIITATEIDKELKKIGRVYDFEPLTQSQLISFINKRFKNAGKVVTRGYITTLINESGYYNKDIDYNLYNLEGDIKKIIALNEEDEISLNNIRIGISDNIEHGVFSIIDAVSSNRKDVAFDLLHQLLLSGQKEMTLLASIISQLEIMVQSKEMAENGCQITEIQKTLKVHEFRVKKALNFARRYTSRDLKKMLVKAYSTDSKIKMGILESSMALEMLIAEI